MIGLWSCFGDELILVMSFSPLTMLEARCYNVVIDMHIYMFYCPFETFTALAKNYLFIEDHHLFDDINSIFGGGRIDHPSPSSKALV